MVIGYRSDKSTLRVHGSRFENNKGLYRKGGSLYLENVFDATVYNTLFMNNTGEKGGSVYTYKSRVSISHVIFFSNLANEYCGGLYSEDSRVNISSTMFKSNTAMFHGAACAVNSEVHTLNSSFNDNKGVKGTGGMFVALSKVDLINSTFSNNRGFDGGALSVKNSTLIAQNTAFIRNVAQNSGGAVYIDSGAVTFLNETIFHDNKDPLGKNVVANKSRVVFPETFSV